MPTTATVEALLRELNTLGKASKLLLGRHPAPGLTPASAAVLGALARDGERRCSELAERMAVDASVVSRQLAELERHGYADRRPDPVDGRASLSFATHAGRDVLAELRDRHAQAVIDALPGWTDDELAGLTDLLRRLSADLHELNHRITPATVAAGGTPRDKVNA